MPPWSLQRRPPGMSPSQRRRRSLRRRENAIRPGSSSRRRSSLACCSSSRRSHRFSSRLTRWTLSDATYIGLDNFAQFFREPFLVQGLINTLIYGGVTSGLKVVLGLLLAVLLTSRHHRPRLSARRRLLPGAGLDGRRRHHLHGDDASHPASSTRRSQLFGIKGPGWLTDPALRACSRSHWSTSGRGSGSRPSSTWPASPRFRGTTTRPRSSTAPTACRSSGTSPCRSCAPATVTVIILSLIGGLRSFDLIWAMTRGGPGFTSDVIASVIYKQYQAGFYGLSTAGNVVLFARRRRDHRSALVVAQPQRGRAMRAPCAALLDRRRRRSSSRSSSSWCRSPSSCSPRSRTGRRLAARVLAAGERLSISGTISSQVIETRDYMLITAFINSIILTVVSVTLLVVFGAMVGSSCSAGRRAGRRS